MKGIETTSEAQTPAGQKADHEGGKRNKETEQKTNAEQIQQERLPTSDSEDIEKELAFAQRAHAMAVRILAGLQQCGKELLECSVRTLFLRFGEQAVTTAAQVLPVLKPNLDRGPPHGNDGLGSARLAREDFQEIEALAAPREGGSLIAEPLHHVLGGKLPGALRRAPLLFVLLELP